MKKILQNILQQKLLEVEKLPKFPSVNKKINTRNFYSAVRNISGNFPKLIAEIKFRSPSNNKIFNGKDFSPANLANSFESVGASAISVLTDKKFFGGNTDFLILAKKNTKKTPILAKDFFISKKQIWQAGTKGADAILLIAKIFENSSSKLNFEKLIELKNFAEKIGLSTVLEIENENELEKILSIPGKKIIGINSRNLEDFSINFGKIFQLAKKIPKENVIIAMSGFFNNEIRILKKISDAVLIGTAICKAENTSKKLVDFLNPKPLLKFCGIRTWRDFLKAEELGVNFIGLNFATNSKRKISEELAEKISKFPKKIKTVGIFQNQEKKFCEKICQKFSIDFVQLSGNENPKDFENFSFPIWKGIGKNFLENIKKWDKLADVFIFDSSIPGSGKSGERNFLEKLVIKKPFFIAGGINSENITEISKKYLADGFDLASGLENSKKTGWCHRKMKKIVKIFQ